MELNQEQQQALSQWVEAGAGLSDLQQKLGSEFDLRMTYMDVRFLLIDLGLELKETQEEPEEDDPDAVQEPEWVDDAGVKVDVDRVVQPGALVSGDVTFTDGVSAKWTLDQTGRLGLDAGDPDYRPSEEDVKAFQQELRSALERQGLGGM